MKNDRREFIKKGTTLAALSLVGISSNKAGAFGIAETKDSSFLLGSKKLSS